MSRIVCGRFDRTLDCDAAIQALRRAGFQPAEIDTFYVGPPGQNQLNPTGGDAPHSSEGSRHAGRGAAIGAGIGLAAGLVVGSIGAIDLGPATVFLGGGLGALVGSFAGAMNSVRAGRRSQASVEHPVEGLGGRMVAVNVDRGGTEQTAMEVLRRYGARDFGRTHGEWRDGSWQDFDPRTPLAV